MGTTYMDFGTGVFHVDGDAPLTQAQVDSVWRHLPTTGASWVERGNLFVQQFDGATAFNLGPVERGVKGASDKVRFGGHAKRHHATKKRSPVSQPSSGWFLRLGDRPYYWSRDGRWLKDVGEAKRFRSEHEAFALSNQLHGAVVVPIEASEESKRHHATKKKSPAQLQREIDEVLARGADDDAGPFTASIRLSGAPAPMQTREFKRRADAQAWLDQQREIADRRGWGNFKFELTPQRARR